MRIVVRLRPAVLTGAVFKGAVVMLTAEKVSVAMKDAALVPALLMVSATQDNCVSSLGACRDVQRQLLAPPD